MTRCQAIKHLELLNKAIDTRIKRRRRLKDEEVLEDTKCAIKLAIADMNALQDALARVSGIEKGDRNE